MAYSYQHNHHAPDDIGGAAYGIFHILFTHGKEKGIQVCMPVWNSLRDDFLVGFPYGMGVFGTLWLVLFHKRPEVDGQNVLLCVMRRGGLLCW